MIPLTDSFSQRYNFKLRYEIMRKGPAQATAYVLERRLLRILGREITAENIDQISLQLDWEVKRLERLIHFKAYKLGIESLRQALEAYTSSGIIGLLKSLQNA